MILENKAILLPEDVTVIPDNKCAIKVLRGQSKLMLKSFNIEFDLLMLALKPSNYAKTLERDRKTFI